MQHPEPLSRLKSLIWISPGAEGSRRRGFRSGVLNSRPQPRVEFRVEVTKLPSPFPNFLPCSFVLTSAPNLRRKSHPRFCVACLPQDRSSSNSTLGEFARVLSCSQYPSRRKPSFLVPSPPSPASSALFRPWSRRALSLLRQHPFSPPPASNQSHPSQIQRSRFHDTLHSHFC